MSEEFYNDVLENIKEYMQDSIDKGYSKFVYNDLGSDVKCVDVISAIDTIKDLYQKEKEKNKFNEEWLNYYKNQVIKINKTINSKIKEWLEYDKKYKTYTSDGRENFSVEYFKAKTLQELQELLEERN